MGLKKKINLKPCGNNMFKEERHSIDGTWIHIVIFRSEDYTKIYVNNNVVKALVWKKKTAWKLACLKEEKEYAARLEAENEVVRLLFENIYVMVKVEIEAIKDSVWEERKNGWQKKIGRRKIELAEQKEDGVFFGYSVLIDGKEIINPIEKGEKAKKRAEKIYLWEMIYEKTGILKEELEFELWKKEIIG